MREQAGKVSSRESSNARWWFVVAENKQDGGGGGGGGVKEASRNGGDEVRKSRTCNGACEMCLCRRPPSSIANSDNSG